MYAWSAGCSCIIWLSVMGGHVSSARLMPCLHRSCASCGRLLTWCAPIQGVSWLCAATSPLSTSSACGSSSLSVTLALCALFVVIVAASSLPTKAPLVFDHVQGCGSPGSSVCHFCCSMCVPGSPPKVFAHHRSSCLCACARLCESTQSWLSHWTAMWPILACSTAGAAVVL